MCSHDQSAGLLRGITCTKRRDGEASIGNQKLGQESTEGTHAEETQTNNAAQAANSNPPIRPLYMHLTWTPGEWADATAGSGAFDGAAYLAWAKCKLSIGLVHGNARLFKTFVGVLTRGIGQRFVEGMDVPVLESMCALSACACRRAVPMSC